MQGRWMGLWSKALAAVGALRGLMFDILGMPSPAFRSIGSPTKCQGALRELCRQGDEVCEGGWRAGLRGRCCAGVVVLVLQ